MITLKVSKIGSSMYSLASVVIPIVGFIGIGEWLNRWLEFTNVVLYKAYVDFLMACCFIILVVMFIFTKKINAIILNKVEVDSRYDRQIHAEKIISSLPKNHPARNDWLLKYGSSAEADLMRTVCMDDWDEETRSIKT